MTTARARPWGVALLLFLATFALYARTAGFGFVEFDDPAYVRDNAHLARGLDASALRWAFTSTDYQYNWHPLTWLSHALDVQCFGLDAGRHHLVNALLHALAAALLLLALHSLSGRPWPSAFAAALFALHPLRVESVAWIAQRKDVLAGVFFALTLLAYAAYARRPSRARFLGVALALAAGLMAKPTLVTLPCVLLLVDVWPLGRLGGLAREPGAESVARVSTRRALLEKLPLFALSAGSAALTLLAQAQGGAIRAALPFSARLANALVAYATYAGEFLLPRRLAVLYPHPEILDPGHTPWLAASGAALLLILAFALALRLRTRAPWLVVGLCWFLGVLVPMIGLVQVGNQAHADRYAYLSLIGLECAVAWSVAALWRAHLSWRPVLVGGALAWLTTLALVSAHQLGYWHDSRTLFEHTLDVTERNFVIHNNLGLALANEQRLDEALVQFQAAAAARPGFYEAELNCGKAYHARGQLERARAAFERAVAARPSSGEARLCLAQTWLALGDAPRADQVLAEALEQVPALLDDARARRLAEELQQRLGDEPR